MKASIFNEALLATARIACCAGFVGTIGCIEKTEDADTSSDADTNSTDDTTDTTDTTDTQTQVEVPEVPNYEECMEAIDAGFATEGFDTSSLVDCCLLTTEQVGYEDLHNNPEYAELNQNCCDLIAQSNEFSSACTPWGPPTPPAMRRIAAIA